MSTVTKSWAPTRSDPVAATARKRKVLLVVLVVLLVAVLAFELPRLMHRSGSSSAAPATDSGQTGLVTDQVATASDTAAAQNAATAQTTAAAQTATGTDAAGGVVATGVPATTPRVSKATVLAIRHRPAKDPFAPLLGQAVEPTASATTPTSAPATSPATSSTTTAPPPATAPAPSTPAEEPKTTNATPTPTPAPAESTATPDTSAPSSTPATTPTVVPVEVKPDVAVVYANGKKQAVGVDQYFKAGDLWFQLLSVSSKTMKISVVGGEFTGGKQAITVTRDHPITLYNTATGVEYTLNFTKGTSGIPTTSQAAPTTESTTAPAASTPPAPATTDPMTTTASDPAATAPTTS